MASSFISFKEYGFWINDSIMELTLHYINDILEQKTEQNSNGWLSEFSEIIQKNSLGLFPAFMNLHLDVYLIDEDRIKTFFSILRKTKQLLFSKGGYIDTKELNLIEEEKESLGSVWLENFKTERVIKVVEYLELLILESLKIKSTDNIDYNF
jgi:hypothetical protein